MSPNARRLATKLGASALAGAAPGASLVLLTGPVSGEAELTLGVGGVALAVAGAVTGLIVAIPRGNKRPG